MLWADEAPQSRAYGLQNAVPHCLGYAVSATNPRPELAEALSILLHEVRKFHPDWFIEEIGIEVDHVHLHMVIPAKYAVSKVVEPLKSATNRRIKEKFPHFLA